MADFLGVGSGAVLGEKGGIWCGFENFVKNMSLN
jgi:hypothetical protein